MHVCVRDHWPYCFEMIYKCNGNYTWMMTAIIVSIVDVMAKIITILSRL